MTTWKSLPWSDLQAVSLPFALVSAMVTSGDHGTELIRTCCPEVGGQGRTAEIRHEAQVGQCRASPCPSVGVFPQAPGLACPPRLWHPAVPCRGWGEMGVGGMGVGVGEASWHFCRCSQASTQPPGQFKLVSCSRLTVAFKIDSSRPGIDLSEKRDQLACPHRPCFLGWGP